MSRRTVILIGALVPVAILLAIFGWALARSGTTPGGLLVNEKLGEVEIEERLAPPFSLELVSGQPLSLEELRGKVVMVDFWSSWCPPCRQEAKDLEAAYQSFRARGVEFVGIAIWDDRGDVQAFLEEFDVQYPNGLDDTGRIAINYGVRGIPEKFFIDREGRLVKKFVGPMTSQDVARVLEEMLAQ